MTNIYPLVIRSRRACLLLSAALLLVLTTAAQPVISFNPIINGSTPVNGAVTNPIDIVNAGDGSNRLFVAQQNGVIKVYSLSPVSFLGDFLTVTGLGTGGERGLLSIAFAPNYASSGYFFVYYTNTSGAIEIARYHTPAGTPNVADPASKQVLLTIPHPGQSNHNGGKLNFGNDGYLYFATGDGGGGGDVPNNAQNGTNLLGKMIRINASTIATGPLYTIPSDNPYLAAGDNIMDEIWAFGLRNPFRWSFDRLNHDMWIGDVGQDAWEEVNFRTAGNTGGINYGWHCMEGTHTYPGSTGCPIAGATVLPVLDYPHNDVTGGVAVIGGFVYRGALNAAMYGYYLFADESSGNVWLLPPGGAAADTIQFKKILSLITSFGESENGELYVTTLNGAVYNIVATGNAALPVKLVGFNGTAASGYNQLNWQTTDEAQLKQYDIEFSTDRLHFTTAGSVTASNRGNYTFRHTTTDKKVFYRLKMVDTDGKTAYSKIIVVAAGGLPGKNFVTPSFVNNGVITVRLDDAYTALQIINMEGKLIYRESISNRTGSIAVQLPAVRAGQYLVRLSGNGKQVTQKIVVQ